MSERGAPPALLVSEDAAPDPAADSVPALPPIAAPRVEEVAAAHPPPERRTPPANDPSARELDDQVRNAADKQRPAFEQQRRTLRDVSGALEVSPPAHVCAPADVTAWRSRLMDERTLVLASEDFVALGAALHALTEDDFFRGAARKVIIHLVKTAPADDDGFELCLLPDDSDDTERPERTLIVVEATTNLWARPFLEDLFRDPVTRPGLRSAKLKRLSRHVLVLTRAGMLDEGGYAKNTFVPCYRLPVADAAHAPEREHAETPLARLGADVLIDTALFVASFLEQLGPAEFQEVLLGLLGDALDPTWRRANEHETPRLLRERWREQNQRLLAAAGLGTSRAIDGTPRLIFTHGSSSDARREEFLTQHFFFYAESCRRVEALGLLIDRRQQVMGAYVTYLGRRAALAPETYDEAWLLPLVLPQATAAGESAGAEPRAVKPSTLGYLLGELYSRGRRELVGKCFTRLCEAGRHDFVLDLAWLLRNTRDFDELLWLRRCLDQGTLELAERAYTRVLRLALERGAPLLEACREWTLTKPNQGLSRAHVAAVRLCTELSELCLWVPPWVAFGPRLIDPSTVTALVELSLVPTFDAMLDEHDRWYWQLKMLLEGWFVPPPAHEFLADEGLALRLRLLEKWFFVSLEETGGPQRGLLLAVLLAGAAMNMEDAARAELATRVHQALAASERRSVRTSLERRLRVIEDCFREVSAVVEGADLDCDDDRALRARWKSERERLRRLRSAVVSFRSALRGPPAQPRSNEHGQSG